MHMAWDTSCHAVLCHTRSCVTHSLSTWSRVIVILGVDFTQSKTRPVTRHVSELHYLAHGMWPIIECTLELTHDLQHSRVVIFRIFTRADARAGTRSCVHASSTHMVWTMSHNCWPLFFQIFLDSSVLFQIDTW